MADGEKLSYEMSDASLAFWTHDGKEYMLLVETDDDAGDPRKDADNVTRFFARHRRMSLGDYGGLSPEDFLAGLVDELVPAGALRAGTDKDGFVQSVRDGEAGHGDALAVLKDYAVIEPVWCYEHSGISIAVGKRAYPYNDRFDSGQLGWMAVTKKDAERAWPDDPDWRARAMEAIQADVKTYNDWLSGDVYWYRLSDRTPPAPEEQDQGVYTDADWDELDSCGGFYGTDLFENGMAEYVDHGFADAVRENRVGTGARTARQVTVYEYRRD